MCFCVIRLENHGVFALQTWTTLSPSQTDDEEEADIENNRFVRAIDINFSASIWRGFLKKTVKNDEHIDAIILGRHYSASPIR